MPSFPLFTAADVEVMAKIVNNVGIYASQILHNHRSDLAQRSLINISKIKKDDDGLLKRLDQMAREQGDESPLRLIEDLSRLPANVTGLLELVRRCLLTTAFLGHCMALPKSDQLSVAAVQQEKHLH